MVRNLTKDPNVFLLFMSDHVGTDVERQLINEDLPLKVSQARVGRDQGEDFSCQDGQQLIAQAS